MKIIGMIPSRYGSTRFPGKPLALIKGKPMIQYVYENVNRFLPLMQSMWQLTTEGFLLLLRHLAERP